MEEKIIPIVAPVEQEPELDIKGLIVELSKEGLHPEEILKKLYQLAEKGKIEKEDLKEAEKILSQEKEEAGKLFGVELL